MQDYKKFLISIVAIMLSFFLYSSPVLAQQPEVFTDSLFLPEGIATDADGNVYVASDLVTNSRLTKFAPDGTVIWDRSYGGFLSFFSGQALITDPRTGLIWNLWTSGEIYLVDPNTGNQTFWFNIRELLLDTSEMYDIQLGPASQYAGQIVPNETLYIDIALRQRDGGQLDAFLTANSSPSKVPYVLRIRFAADGAIESAKVLLLSIAGRTEFSNQMGGVASNQNLIFATIYRSPPLNVPPELARSYQIPVSFSPNFPEDGSTPAIRFEGADLNTEGMTTDVNGNFFMATGSIGTSLCGLTGRGAMVILPANLNVPNIKLEPRLCPSIESVPINSVNTRTVAVSPAGDFAYVVESPNPGLSNRNVVWRFPFPGGVTFSQISNSHQIYLPLLSK